MGALEEVKNKINSDNYEIQDIPILLKALEEIIDSDDEIKGDLKGIPPVRVLISIKGVINVFFEVKDGKFASGEKKIANPDITIAMDEDVAKKIVSGDEDTASAYINKKIAITGDLSKAISIRSVLEQAAEVLGLDIAG